VRRGRDAVKNTFAVALVCTLALAGLAHAVPFWGSKESQPPDTDPAKLKPGEFVWEGEAVPSGPIVVVVSLPEQRAYVYRNGVRVGVSTASTGKPGHRTPAGVFTVLQKDKDHHSKTYNNAAMPWTERLTWDGVALHAGGLPGYPSSHGCVHLPSEFARELFLISPMGMTVVVADDVKAPIPVEHPGALSPVDPTSGAERVEPRLADDEELRWQPEKSATGPVSIVISGTDRRAVVLRNGIEIGRAKLEVDDPTQPLGTHAWVMMAAAEPAGKPRWLAVGLPGYANDAGRPLDPAQAARVQLPPSFRDALVEILAPGDTLFVTDAPVLESTTGVQLNILNADPPAH
jgi:hypothetical protein